MHAPWSLGVGSPDPASISSAQSAKYRIFALRVPSMRSPSLRVLSNTCASLKYTQLRIKVLFGWIYKVLSSSTLVLSHLRHLSFRALPILHSSFVVHFSPLSTVESLELITLRSQSFSEFVRLVNRFPQLRRLAVTNCQWKIPSRC